MIITSNELYNIGERYLTDGIYPSKQYITGIDGADSIITEVCDRIAQHNTIGYCHPVDSFLQVLLDISEDPIDISYSTYVDDKELSGFMVNTVLVALPIIAYHIDNNMTWREAIQTIYENGTVDFFATAGRHLASENPDSATDSLLKNFNM